jgi:hypothetical protein
VAEIFSALLNYSNRGLPPTNGSTPPPLLAPEVQYAKTESDRRNSFAVQLWVYLPGGQLGGGI